MITGIYKIENTINKKVYIGQSNNISLRFSNHKYELNNNKHSNSHLQRAWNKYGKENFTFEILCECNLEELNEKEIYFIGLYCSFEHGYNRTEGGSDSEAAAEFGRRMAKIMHERKRTTKNKCLECGTETRNGYNKYCPEHKYKCKKCETRCSNWSKVCKKCKRTYGKNNNINPIIGTCYNCKKEIIKNSNKQKYCKECAETKITEQQKILMRKRRAVTK
jgi:group I intron endonuclease